MQNIIKWKKKAKKNQIEDEIPVITGKSISSLINIISKGSEPDIEQAMANIMYISNTNEKNIIKIGI